MMSTERIWQPEIECAVTSLYTEEDWGKIWSDDDLRLFAVKMQLLCLYHELYHIHWFRQFLFIWKWGRSGQELVLYELINFIVSSSFIMKHALKGYYSVCALFVLRQNWTTLLTWLNFFFFSCFTFTASWRRHASLIVEKIWAWKEWHTLPIHCLITEVQKIIVFVQNLYWMQLIIRSENYIFLIKKFPMLSNGFLLIM